MSKLKRTRPGLYFDLSDSIRPRLMQVLAGNNKEKISVYHNAVEGHHKGAIWSVAHGQDSQALLKICRDIYNAGMNDSHIQTALREIILDTIAAYWAKESIDQEALV